jgi:hypothetical protein
VIIATFLFGIVEEFGKVGGPIGGVVGVLDAFPSAGEGGFGCVPPFDEVAEMTLVVGRCAEVRGGGRGEEEGEEGLVPPQSWSLILHFLKVICLVCFEMML